MSTAVSRKRVNFMIDLTLLEEMEGLVPAGDRSNFVNAALEEKLTEWSRAKAFELIEAFKQTHRHKKMTDEQLLKDIHHGRK